MGEFLVYTLKSGLLLTFLFAAYKLALGKSGRLTFRRVALLLIYACALLIPLVDACKTGSVVSSNEVAAGSLVSMVTAAGQTGGYLVEESAWYVDILNVLAVVMLAGIAVSLLLTAVGFLRIAGYRLRSRREFVDGMPVAVIGDSMLTPFTFGTTIYLSEKEFREKDPMVLAHEHCHRASLHYVDLVLARIAGSIMWWNPFAWLMLREIHDVHEFQADEYVVSSGYDIRNYQMLLIRKAAGTRLQTFADSLNHSKLKTRLTMMKKSEKRGSLLGAALMIPAVVAGAFMLSTDTVASMLEPMRNVDIKAMIPSERESFESGGKGSENSVDAQEIVIARLDMDAENGVKSVAEDTPSTSGDEAFMDAVFGYKDDKQEEKTGDKKDNNPAIRIDGELMPDGFDMSTISPDDIESIAVFKDNPEKYPNGLIDITLKKGDKKGGTNASASDEPLKVVGYGAIKKSDIRGDEIPNVYVTTNINNVNGTNVSLIIVLGNGEEIGIYGAQLVVNGKTYDANSVSSSFSKSDDMSEQKVDIKLNKTLHKFDSKKDKIILQTSTGVIRIPLYDIK